MRIVIGLLFACHGGTKILGFPANQYGPAQSTLGFVSGWIELICGFLIAFGFLTRIAAFFASGEMAVAYFMFSVGRGFFPIANGGEVAVAYCFVFVFIVFYGSGHWSIDSAFKQKSAARVTA
ncbi:MAG: DoxX family protein [Verrucomicrobia bacterium]|nr:DoxX family protein [Verrucomicrobiota bacterium]